MSRGRVSMTLLDRKERCSILRGYRGSHTCREGTPAYTCTHVCMYSTLYVHMSGDIHTLYIPSSGHSCAPLTPLNIRTMGSTCPFGTKYIPQNSKIKNKNFDFGLYNK